MPKLKFHDAEISEVMSEWSGDYHPTVRLIEPDETVSATVTEDLALPNGQGYLTRYRRSTNFAGNLTEAIKVIGYGK